MEEIRDILFSEQNPGTGCPNVSAYILIIPLTDNGPPSMRFRHRIATVQPLFESEWILAQGNIILKRG
jgi:hypothetical protein